MCKTTDLDEVVSERLGIEWKRTLYFLRGHSSIASLGCSELFFSYVKTKHRIVLCQH